MLDAEYGLSVEICDGTGVDVSCSSVVVVVVDCISVVSVGVWVAVDVKVVVSIFASVEVWVLGLGLGLRLFGDFVGFVVLVIAVVVEVVDVVVIAEVAMVIVVVWSVDIDDFSTVIVSRLISVVASSWVSFLRKIFAISSSLELADLIRLFLSSNSEFICKVPALLTRDKF